MAADTKRQLPEEENGSKHTKEHINGSDQDISLQLTLIQGQLGEYLATQTESEVETPKIHQMILSLKGSAEIWRKMYFRNPTEVKKQRLIEFMEHTRKYLDGLSGIGEKKNAKWDQNSETLFKC